MPINNYSSNFLSYFWSFLTYIPRFIYNIFSSKTVSHGKKDEPQPSLVENNMPTESVSDREPTAASDLTQIEKQAGI